MPLVNNGFVKANESGVKTNFRDFQIAAEMFLRESGGKHINQNNLNVYLDKVHELKEVDNSIVTKSKDSWGKPYHVEFGDRKIIFYSTGGSEIYWDCKLTKVHMISSHSLCHSLS